jgi:hypothetical protein
MKTRYQLLQDAGDTLDTLIKQLVVLRETGLAEDAEQLQNRLSEITLRCGWPESKWKNEQLTDSGYEEQTEDHEREARAAYEAAPKPRTEICQECNEPIIDGQASCHKMGCKSNQEIEF